MSYKLLKSSLHGDVFLNRVLHQKKLHRTFNSINRRISSQMFSSIRKKRDWPEHCFYSPRPLSGAIHGVWNMQIQSLHEVSGKQQNSMSGVFDRTFNKVLQQLQHLHRHVACSYDMFGVRGQVRGWATMSAFFLST